MAHPVLAYLLHGWPSIGPTWRTQSKARVAPIVASIQEFGWTNPVLVDGEGGITAGHGRVMVAEVLGLVEVPTIELRGLTEAQRRAYVIADNKLALNSGWDEAMLAEELSALRDEGYALELTASPTTSSRRSCTARAPRISSRAWAAIPACSGPSGAND